MFCSFLCSECQVLKGIHLRNCIMRQPFGQLKVTVVQGKRLVIRDFKSSDPYVVLKLGTQVISSSALFIICCLVSTFSSIIKCLTSFVLDNMYVSLLSAMIDFSFFLFSNKNFNYPSCVFCDRWQRLRL